MRSSAQPKNPPIGGLKFFFSRSWGWQSTTTAENSKNFPFFSSFIAFLLCLFLLFTVVVWSPVAMDAETIVVSLYAHVDIE
jgi:hypothetical protein